MRYIDLSTYPSSGVRRLLGRLAGPFNEGVLTFGVSGASKTHLYSAPKAVLVQLALHASNILDIREQIPIPGRFE